MGNIFSRPKTTNEKLFEYEEKILNIEAQLINLRRSKISWRLLGMSAILVPIFIAAGLGKWLSFFGGTALAMFVVVFRTKYKNSCIRMAEYKLKKLREEQKNCVKYAKEDVNFAKTRRLIEKYEDEKMKEAFFKTVVKRKHTNASKLADFILANDPNKMNALICKFCGQHNGLVDPRNPDITHFYCYDCKKRNDRVGIEEMKDEDTLFEEKMEEALTKEAD